MAKVIMFYGASCPHCHHMFPIVNKLVKEGFNIEKKEVWEEVIKALKPGRNISSSKKDGFDDAADALALAIAHYHKYIEEGIK